MFDLLYLVVKGLVLLAHYHLMLFVHYDLHYLFVLNRLQIHQLFHKNIVVHNYFSIIKYNNFVKIIT